MAKDPTYPPRSLEDWRKTARLIGGDLFAGAAGRLLFWVGLMVMASLAISHFTDIGRDNTDSPTERSDMRLLIDHGTGCQYLNRGSAITPRLGRDGKQVCR